jgi:putative hydrolase of the HAD superfamily
VRVRAVVFDFYGTLSVSATAVARRAGASRIAAELGIPAERLHAVIAETFTERATGVCGDLEQTMRWLAERCGGSPSADELASACAIRRETEGLYARALRPESEPTLRALHEKGIRIGLLSDCTHELPETWPSLPISPYVDHTVFSVVAGLRKPHPTLYTAITSALGVASAECVYVGDGGSGELTGATLAGMTALRLDAPDAADAVVYDADSTWTGPSLPSLIEVLHHIA